MSKNLPTKRALALAATTAVALGGSVLVAAPAQAATVWDAVAQCESGGNWSINTGNGYYGGLQFSASTWRAYGGTQYAANAHQASKAEQITVAQRTLASQGPGAWPTCSVKAGLTRSNGGAASAVAPAAKAPTTTKAAPKASAAKTTPTKTTATKTTATKKATTAKAAAAAPVKATSTAGKRYVTVKAGDTLSRLAATHGVRGGWQSLYELNQDEIDNPNLIYVGQRFVLS